MKPLIVGQAPARGNNGLPPFAGLSGARLAKLAGVGTSGDALPAHFDMINLMPYYPGRSGRGDFFDAGLARQNALKLRDKLRGEPTRYVLLMGRKVMRAMGVNYTIPWLEWFMMEGHNTIGFPHPSGLNHWWNDPEHSIRASMVLKHVLSHG